MVAIETDYLVVGAGASGMAFTGALIADADVDVDVVKVDRRHSPRGHWNDAYPFVRLHQPSATYGVNSRPLGTDTIDVSGPNAGFYERATGVEICDYFRRVLEDQFVGSGHAASSGSATTSASARMATPSARGSPVRPRRCGCAGVSSTPPTCRPRCRRRTRRRSPSMRASR